MNHDWSNDARVCLKINVFERNIDFQLTVDNAKNVEFHRHRRETVNVFTMDENIAKLLASMDAMKTTLDEKMVEIDTKLDANTVATQDALKVFKDQVNGDLAK